MEDKVEKTEYGENPGAYQESDVVVVPENERQEEEFDLETIGIIGYLYYIFNYLKETRWEDIEDDVVMDSLESIADTLEKIESFYYGIAPLGASTVKGVMLDIISTLLNAMEELAAYMEENQNWHVDAGLKLLREAESLSSQLHVTVSQQRLELAELRWKLESGKINEGQKIDDDASTSFNLTDTDAATIVIEDGTSTKRKVPKSLPGEEFYQDEECYGDFDGEASVTEEYYDDPGDFGQSAEYEVYEDLDELEEAEEEDFEPYGDYPQE